MTVEGWIALASSLIFFLILFLLFFVREYFFNRTPTGKLMLAAKKGDAIAVESLLLAGMNAGGTGIAPTSDNVTALHLAAKFGHIEIVQMLLAHGTSARPRCTLKDLLIRPTPLYLAVKGGHIRVAALLLSQGARVDDDDDDRIAPMLYLAANNHDPQLVQLLLAHGAVANRPLKVRGDEGLSPDVVNQIVKEVLQGESHQICGRCGQRGVGTSRDFIATTMNSKRYYYSWGTLTNEMFAPNGRSSFFVCETCVSDKAIELQSKGIKSKVKAIAAARTWLLSQLSQKWFSELNPKVAIVDDTAGGAFGEGVNLFPVVTWLRELEKERKNKKA